MNYIKELNAFYDRLETKPLSTSAIALWHALMHINNKTGWADTFAVAVSVLCLKTGLSERTISNARNELESKGYIKYKSRKGNKSAIYKMVSLSAINADSLSYSLSDNLSDSVSDNPSALFKLNETKRNETKKNTSTTSKGPETIPKAHERIYGFPGSKHQFDVMYSYVDDGMEEMVVIHAMERAAEVSTTHSFPLIKKILNDYLNAKAFTLDQAKAVDAEFEKRKQQNKQPKSNNKPSQPKSWGALQNVANQLGGGMDDW